LLAAGYPLAGDLSLGGFRSENITGGGENMSAEEAVERWTGDAPHLTTMISPDLTEIGAGVAVVNGRVYYVIDCARPTTANVPPVATTPLAGGSAVPMAEATVQPVQALVVSTPNAEGNIIHEVKFGQTLWLIAIAYETKIDEIKQLNNLTSNDIYPGEKLLIKMGVSATELVLTETSTPEVEPSSTYTSTVLFETPTETRPPTPVLTITPAFSAPSASNSRTMSIAIGLIVLALIGGLLASMGGTKKNAD
jgi:LysM repeat protein